MKIAGRNGSPVRRSSRGRELSAERGSTTITVAEIADAANIAVKDALTLHGAKEELPVPRTAGVIDASDEEVGHRRNREDAHSSRGAGAAAEADARTRTRNWALPAMASRDRRRFPHHHQAASTAGNEDPRTPHRGAGRAQDRNQGTGNAGLTAAQILVLVRTVTRAEVGDSSPRAATRQPALEAIKACNSADADGQGPRPAGGGPRLAVTLIREN